MIRPQNLTAISMERPAEMNVAEQRRNERMQERVISELKSMKVDPRKLDIKSMVQSFGSKPGELTQALLDTGFHQDLCDADIDLQCTDEGVTPLHRACYHGHTKNVACLLGAKASLTCRNHEGVDPLTMAMAGNTPAAQKITKLLRKAASADTTTASDSSAVESTYCTSSAFFNCRHCHQGVPAHVIRRCAVCRIAMYCSRVCVFVRVWQ